MILPGFILRKAKMLGGEAAKGISNFVLYVAQPAMIVFSFLRPFDRAILGNCLAISVFSILTNGFGCLIVGLFFRKVPERRRKVLRFSVAFANVLFMGLPVVTGVFGEEAAIYASVYAVWFNVFLWSFGVMFYTGDRRYASPRYMVLNPCTIASIIGILLFVTSAGKYVPGVLADALEMLGATVTPLAMTVIGIRFAEADPKTLFNDPRLYEMCALRLIGGPLVAFAFLMLARLIFGYDNATVRFIIIILCSTPTASTTGMFAEKYGGDTVYASKCVSLCTALSLLTMPLAAMLAGI